MNSITIYDLIATRMQSAPEAHAILAPGKKPLTYRRLVEHLQSTVAYLNGLGLKPEDRVAVVLSNGPEMAALFLAVSSGMTCAPLNLSYGESEFDFYLTDLRAKAVIVEQGLDSPVRKVAKDRGIAIIELIPSVDDEAGIFTLVSSEDCQKALEEPSFAPSDSVALVLHTSGTTSRPKIVPLTQRNLCISAGNIARSLKLTESDRCMNVMPLFHIHGLVGALLSSLSAGASVICTHGFNAPQFFDLMYEFKSTWYTAVPTMHQAILARAEANQDVIKDSRLRFIRSCSSALPPQLMADLEQCFGVPVVEAYGMTEASHQMACNPLPPQIRKPGSVGIPTGPEVAIMDDAGKLLAPGETGEIVIRGENVTAGYENNPKANESAFTNGWFRTGDQGYLDDDGYLFITGRIKEIINRGGEKISPREIDEVLIDHPAVAQAITFAMPHPTLGDDIAAAVVLKQGMDASELDIREFVAARVAHFKVPSKVVFVDEIPKGPTGKLQRIGLAERLGITAELQDKGIVEYVPPRTPVEESLAKMWAEVLGVKRVGINDHFFRLGGDSILATQLVARAREAFNVDLSLVGFFESPTVAGQALMITQLQAYGLSEDELSNLLDDLERGSDQPL